MEVGKDFNCAKSPKEENGHNGNRDIAIIGIGLKFPMAETAEEFYHLLRNGICAVRDIPLNRKRHTESYLSFRGKTEEYAFEKAGYLERIDCFDHSFFHISPKEASYMDPNQRIFLQTVWKAVEDSGYGAEQMRGSNTGIYVGYSGEADYRNMITETDAEALPIATAGNLPAVIGGRVSYLMDLKGPNLLVNTMCSSSLAAIHLACQAIRAGECDMAVAGGIQLHILPVRLARIGIESEDHLTKAFDDSSDGTGGGEGSAAVLLKPFHKAEQDRDNIYAVIKGSALNQDGATAGISAPSPGAQKKVILRAWEDAGIHPESITYIEAHGSGTKLGDPIEIQGIRSAFKEYTDRMQFCALGSVKSNLGHLDACAGAAGFIKAVLSLKYKEIPATLHFKKPNRNIRFHNSPVYINSVRQTWEENAGKRRCGVSSFGFSGTNCHIVLEEYQRQTEADTGDKSYLLPLSAKTKTGLMRLVEMYIKFLTAHKSDLLSDICYTAATGRGHYEYRLGIICRSREELIERLRAFAPDSKPDSVNTFYGFFELIPEDRREKENHMRTEQEIRRLSADAGRTVQCVSRKDESVLQLQEIAFLYTKGAGIDWKLLYGSQKRNKISIPLYPFEETAHWLPIPANPAHIKELAAHTYFQTKWQVSTLGKENLSAAAEGFTLVFMNRGRRCRQLAEALEADTRNLIRVYLGESLNKQERTVYTVLPDKMVIKKMFRELPGISGIVYMYSLTDSLEEEPGREGGREEQILDPFLALAAAVEESITEPMDFILLTDMGAKVDEAGPFSSASDAMLISVLKCLCAEHPYISGRSIDVDRNTKAAVIAQDVMSFCGKTSIAYRRGIRYKEVLTKAEIPMKNQSGKIRISDRGVYVITGGTGGLGLVTASFLAEQAPVKIALINRTPMPDRREWKTYLSSGSDEKLRRKIQRIQELEQMGAVIESHAADLLDLKQLSSLFGRLEKKHHRINGIFHCAGVGAGLMGEKLHEQTEEKFKTVMGAKVRGTYNLEIAVQHMQLDFFLVYSSPVTLTGGVGSAAYAAGNAFLNIWAGNRNKIDSYPAIAVSWAPWEESFPNGQGRYDKNVHMFLPLSSDEMKRGLDQALKSGLSEMIVGRINRHAELWNTRELLFFELDRPIALLLGGNSRTDCGIISNFDAYDLKITGIGERNVTSYIEIAAKAFGIILDLKTIDLYDNFFELGGDSIIALKIINLINDKCGISVGIAELLKNPHVKELAAVIEQKVSEKKTGYSSGNAIHQLEKRPFYPLSEAQRRIYMLSQKEGIENAYHLTEFLQLDGELNTVRLENVLIKIIQRHEGLRTTFKMREGRPVQMIRETVDFKLKCTGMEEQSYESLAEQFVKPFELSRETFRAELYKFSETRHLLLIDMHHIICDGVSRTILLQEIADLYNGKALPCLRIQYKEFACWEQEEMRDHIRKKGKDFWMNMLGHELPLLKLPVKGERSRRPVYEGSERKAFMDEELSADVKAYAKKQGCSLFVVLLSVYFILLEKYTGESDFVVGTAFAGRERMELEAVVGVFLNLLPIRCYPKPEKIYTDFLKEVKEVVLLAGEYQSFPLEEMIEESGIRVQPGRNPFYDTMFLMQNTGSIRLCMDGLEAKTHRFKNQSSKLDLTLEVEEVQKQLCIVAEYASQLFEEAVIDELLRDYMEILKKVIGSEELKVKDIWLESNIKIPKKTVLDMEFNFDW